jgi:hypothetical protein
MTDMNMLSTTYGFKLRKMVATNGTLTAQIAQEV